MGDPLSSFAVAGNVLQFVEVGTKLLLKTREVYKSSTGLIKEHESLEAIASNLQTLNADLEQHGDKQPSDLASQHVLEANQACLDVSKEFLQLLNALKPDSAHPNVWKCIKLAAKATRKQERLQRLEASVSHNRDNLVLSLLGLVKRQNEDLAADFAASSTAMQAQLMQWLQTQDERPVESLHDVTCHDLVASLSQKLAPKNADVDAVKKEISSLSILKANSIRRLKDSLYFFEMDGWRNHVEPAHHDTFRWIMDDAFQSSQRWDSFLRWVDSTDGQRIYWMRGKPGSGKSTMMRYLHHQLDAHTDFTAWMAQRKVVKANVFLWHGSSTIQRSMFGLLRTLLYRIWREVPDVISDSVHFHRWACALRSESEVEPWTTMELRDALLQTLQLTANGTGNHTNILLLIDGLDEYEGSDKERQNLTNLLESIIASSHVKICVTSRHSTIYKDAFETYPQLCLEDMTQEDISTYARDTLCANKLYQRLQRRAPQATDLLVREIVRSANGVFLCANLAIRSILKSVRDGSNATKLMASLKALPVDLEHYYLQMLQAVPVEYRRDASIILQTALYDVLFAPSQHQDRITLEDDLAKSVEERRHQLSGPCLLLLYLRYLDDFDDGFESHFSIARDFEPVDLSDDEETDHWLDVLERRLTSRTMGLLEVTTGAKTESPKWNTMVTFLHRSVKDFLLRPNIRNLLHDWSGGPFDVHAFRSITVAADIVGFSNPVLVDDLHTLRLYAISCFMSMITQKSTASGDPDVYWKLFDWLIPQLRLDSAEWSRQNSKARIGVSDILLDITGRWHADGSDLLSFAVAFGWASYVNAYTESRPLARKSGRPLLDYALRPCRNRPCQPYPQLVECLLAKGADPNQIYNGASVWIHFIVMLMVLGKESEPSWAKTVEAMLSSTVSQCIPVSQLGVALEDLLVERCVLSGEIPDLLQSLKQYKPNAIAEDGDEMYDICHVLEAVRKYGMHRRQGLSAVDEEEQVDQASAGDCPIFEAVGPEQLGDGVQGDTVAKPSWTGVSPAATMTRSSKDISQVNGKVKCKVNIRPLTPEPRCGYSQTAQGGT